MPTLAAGIAAAHGQLDKLVRVWTLGDGIGFGRYPLAEEFGKAATRSCRSIRMRPLRMRRRGHLESIMGHRAMRLRFLDMEPEKFSPPREGDPRCAEFAPVASRAGGGVGHQHSPDGPGKFFIAGANAGFVQVGRLSQYLQEMVAMSPLQGSVFEVVPASKSFRSRAPP